MKTDVLTKIAPTPWAIAPLEGKYYGTRIVDANGNQVCEIWNHDPNRYNLAERRVSRREEEKYRDKMTDKEWNEFLDEDLCDSHYESEEDYLLACKIVAEANRAAGQEENGIEIERERCLKLLESDLPIADAIALIRSGGAPPTLPPGYEPKMRAPGTIAPVEKRKE